MPSQGFTIKGISKEGEWIVVGIACSRGSRPRGKCQFCRTRTGDRLCDRVIERKAIGKVMCAVTCDKRMCATCGTRLDVDLDFCPDCMRAVVAEFDALPE